MEDKKHLQKTLTPIILEKGMPGYETVQDIEEKLNDPEVFNIAITGPYGSGKSTVLKSLKAQFPDSHKYLTISLASLTGNKDDEEKDLDEKEQQKIEYSLLQQLIYKEKPETLPKSRFRRISRKSAQDIIKFGVGIISFIICFLVVFEPQWMRVDTIYQLFDLGGNWNLVFDVVCSAYMLCCVFALSAYTYRRSLFSRIRSLNVKDVQIELDQESSVFNKHLEEIVYFFESTDYNVVIIEDLDRFRCPEIFQKLREINFLLRESKVLKEQQRSIKFIYAIKDDLFKDAERTKFFDYIATVTPVVNPKNSCEKLTQELSARGYMLEKDALRDLSEFVDDMRMLKNVANEFQQYMERLSRSSSPNQERLLAMIIYKNHHPDDFGKLHYKKGKIYDFIRQKPEWVQIAIDKVIIPRLNVWQKKREDVVNSHKFTLKQWRILYMEKYREHLDSSLLSISIQGGFHSIASIAESESLFETLIKQSHLSFKYKMYSGSSTQTGTTEVNFSEIEKEVDDQIGYQKRKELIATTTADIDNEIRMVREEENRLKNFKLAKLLIQFPEIKKSEKFIQIGLSELMVYFLQRGYIDETYYDYLTLYDGTTMSLNDRDLLSRIRQNDVNVNYDEPIDDISAFVEELPLFVYEYRSVLNYQIADYLEAHPVICKSALQNFEQHFVASTTPPLDFMANYYKKGSCGADSLWKKYVKTKMSWQRMQTYEKQEYWDTLVEAWLSYCELSDITDSIREWLNNNLGFCVERLKAIGIEQLKVITEGCKFDDLHPLGPVGGVFQGDDVLELGNHIIGNKMFELTRGNVCVACVITSSPFAEDVTEEVLTMTNILQSENQGLREYVEENIQKVFKECIVESEGQEKEEGLLSIINEESLDENQKIAYLLKQKTNKIIDVLSVNDEYKTIAIRSKVLKPSWSNVIGYYASQDEIISEDLKQFVEDNVVVLKNEPYPKDVESALASDLVFGPYLKIEIYRELLPNLMTVVEKEDEDKFDKNTGVERTAALVKGKYLSNDIETAKTVCQYGSHIYAEYLSNHIANYLLCFDEYDQDAKSVSLLLSKGSTISGSQRWSLAKLVPASLVATSTELADSLVDVILWKKEELAWTVVEAMLKIASPNGSKMRLQEWLLKNNRGDLIKITTILQSMQNPYAEIVNYTKRPLVPKEFQDYLDMILPLGLFTSYKEEKNGLRVYHSTK